MNKNLICDGQPTAVWHGISWQLFLKRCAQATDEEARLMGHVSSLMAAGEVVTHDEFAQAEAALRAVEKRLIANYPGEVKLNRRGLPHGGCHPALL